MFSYRLLNFLVFCLLSFAVSANNEESYRKEVIKFENNWQTVEELIRENLKIKDETITNKTIKMSSMTDLQLQYLEEKGLNFDKLISINSRLEQALTLLQNNDKQENDIDIEPIDVTPSICNSASVVEVYSLKVIKTLALEILSAAKWGCREEAFGDNFALLCLSAEEHAQLAEAAVEVATVCLSAKRNAREDAMLETIHGITEHLNENLDTAISTRTSEEQVMTVINDSKQVNLTLDNTLPIQLPNIQNILDNLLQKLSANEQKLIDLQTRTTDLTQRQQLNNAQSIDIDQRIADIELLIIEIRNDTQSIKQKLLTLDNLLQQQPNHQQLETGHMAWAMSQQLGKNIVAYQLPNAYGGQLENIRELVAQSISNSALAGLKTTQAQAFFNSGDTAYNASNYALAYTSYANAFRLLGTIDVKHVRGQ